MFEKTLLCAVCTLLTYTNRLSAEVLFDLAVNSFGGEAEFFVKHSKGSAVSEMRQTENTSFAAGHSFKHHGQTGSEEEFLSIWGLPLRDKPHLAHGRVVQKDSSPRAT